jgi:hypothetical protein
MAWFIKTIRDAVSNASFVGGVAIGLSIALPCQAQQPPAWSPNAFTAPSPTQNPSKSQLIVPPNRLRFSQTTETQEVQRWRSPREESLPPTQKSFAQAMEGESSVRLASYSESSVQTKPQSNSTSVGVWVDRSGSSQSNVIPSESVTRARFQEAQAEPTLPGTLSLPPANKSLPDPIPATPPKLEDLEPPSGVEPPNLKSPTERPGRSLLDQAPTVPNPFPSSRQPKRVPEKSPSDGLAPPSMKSLEDSDPAPQPPKSNKRSFSDCDSIRQAANEFDITKIRVDSSPVFGQGIPDEKRKPTNTKEDFVANAQSQNWYNQEGEVVAVGKLVDIEYGMVILEKDDGSRASYPLRKLSEYDQRYISQAWSFPMSCSLDDGSFPSRDFVETTMTWKATGACHKPLYFEEVSLERYGHEWGPVAQPVISTMNFFGNIAVLPYKMGIHPINECQYSLGYYRPGSCAPWTVGPVPLSLRGALFQAKVVTGTALALP